MKKGLTLISKIFLVLVLLILGFSFYTIFMYYTQPDFDFYGLRDVTREVVESIEEEFSETEVIDEEVVEEEPAEEDLFEVESDLDLQEKLAEKAAEESEIEEMPESELDLSENNIPRGVPREI